MSELSARFLVQLPVCADVSAESSGFLRLPTGLRTSGVTNMHANYPEALGELHLTCEIRKDASQNHRVIGKLYLLDFVLEISSRPIRHSFVYR
jgi:hypothetical protein